MRRLASAALGIGLFISPAFACTIAVESDLNWSNAISTPFYCHEAKSIQEVSMTFDLFGQAAAHMLSRSQLEAGDCIEEEGGTRFIPLKIIEKMANGAIVVGRIAGYDKDVYTVLSSVELKMFGLQQKGI